MSNSSTGNIICKNVCKSYKNKKILENINLELEPGKIYGLIGRNGVGKTTLLSIMSAQTPADSGDITIGGEQVWENKRALRNICFSRELNTSDTMGVAALKVKNYLDAAKIFYPDWDNNMAGKLVDLFGIDIKQQISKLSKGMASMITIIVAMASKARYTFLDEPVAGLDVVARDDFYKLLLDEYMSTGRTFVVSTHIIDEAADVFEEVIILKDKGIMLKENTAELLDRAYHVSGKTETVDDAVSGLKCMHEENIGRSKGVTILLEEGQSIKANPDISIQKVSLQNLFVALCGREAGTDDRL